MAAKILNEQHLYDFLLKVISELPDITLQTPEENHFVDPEGSTFGTGLAGQLGEFGGLPTSATYGLALKLSF